MCLQSMENSQVHFLLCKPCSECKDVTKRVNVSYCLLAEGALYLL